MGVNPYTPILETTTGSDSQIEDNEKLPLELLEARSLELNGFENNSGLAEYTWPEMSSRRRGRHSYSYYNLNSN